MSAFTETAFVKKLADLNLSQQSIQTLSLWLIHHRKHHNSIVSTWLRELKNAAENRKLILMYLANDVIQNSKKKGPEYNKEFINVLPDAFGHLGETCKSERVIGSIGRMLCIWEDRGVYDEKLIARYRGRLNRDKKASDDDDKTQNGGVSDKSDQKNGNQIKKAGNDDATTGKPTDDKEKKDKDFDKQRSKHDPSNRKRMSSSLSTTTSSSSSSSSLSKRHGSSGSSNSSSHHAAKKRGRHGQSSNGAAGSSGRASSSPENAIDAGAAYVPSADPPESEDLIRALINLENSASSDAAVRERIAHFPPEISELTYLAKLEDKEEAKRLAIQVKEAMDLLNEYNSRLSDEMEERNKLYTMICDYRAELKSSMAKTEKKIEDYKKKLSKMAAIQKQIHDHLTNFPDFSYLPNIYALPPLPSAGDLFNAH